MSLVNYLGTYETLDQVWEAYPEGGKEGDYLHIASDLKKWNKYTSAWADPTEEDVEGSTIVSLEEDVVVGSSTLINYLGRFETLGDALNAYPEGGNEGDYIYVGDDIYAWDKYANEWVVSLDAPLEVAISEEDIIPNSNTFINYLGGFVDRDAVWHKYPEGGKVGDYLYIASDLHIWNKYICNWVAATPPDESSQIRPIEHLSQEGVVEYSENYINYLGVFESIEQAWEAYPEGGKEGDYIIVGGEQLRWNKYTSNWGEYDPDASTPARPVATIYGDLHVHNDVIIGEDLYARILETFTTKKWVLEQGYISLDDVTSELVMSKIVPDNTTIEVRDGKLVVIGGGSGGGTADSVAWDDVTDKPKWIKDTPPTLEEISGSNGDGFVTILSDQTIEGVKNFAKGAKFNSALLSYDDEKKAWVFPGNIIATGGIAAFSSIEGFTPATITDAVNIDWDTIIKKDGVLMLNPELEFGGIDEEQLEEYLKPYAKTADIANTYATKASLATLLSGKADKATTLAGYGIANAYTKDEVNTSIDTLNTAISDLRKYANDTFVPLATAQSITARHNFTDGLTIGGLPIYKSQDDIIYIDANVVVRGGITSRGTNKTTTPTLFDALPIDERTIKRNAEGVLYVDEAALNISTGGGGIDEDFLSQYLSDNRYATQDWVLSQRYLTGISSSMVTDALGYTPLSTGGGTVNGSINISGGRDLILRASESSVNDPGDVVFERNDGSELARFYYGSDARIRLRQVGSGDGVLVNSVNIGDYALTKSGGIINNLDIFSTTSINPLSVAGNNRSGFIGMGSYSKGVYSRYGLISFPNENGSLYRYTNGYEGYEIIDSGNYSNYAPSINTNIVASKDINHIGYGYTFNGCMTTGPMITFGADVDYFAELQGDFDGYALYYRTYANGYTDTKTIAFTDDVVKNYGNNMPVDVNNVVGYGQQHDGWLYYGPAITFGLDDYKLQLQSRYDNPTMYVRSYYKDGGGFSDWKTIAFTDSNVASATKLQTPRAFWGHSFDGTSDINGNIYFSAGGNYKIGTPYAANHQVLYNYITFGADENGIEYVSGKWTSSWNLVAHRFVTNHSDYAIAILNNGNVAFGGTTAEEKLHVYGNILAMGGITGRYTSDRRLKENIRKFSASKILMSLGGVFQFEYADSEVAKNNIYGGSHIGLIYQNVQGTALDRMCHENENGYGSLNYLEPSFISLIAGATMENVNEIAKLKKENRALRKRIEQLEKSA